MKNQPLFRCGHEKSPFNIVQLLKACTDTKDLHKGSKLHEYVWEHRYLGDNAHLGSTLVAMYAKCGALTKAQQVLEELPIRDVFCWSALIAGCAQNGQGEEALKCFDDMLCEGHCPDAVTFISVLKACGTIGAAAKGEEIHKKIVSMGMLENNIVLGNSLVGMYIKCGAFCKAQQVLKELPTRDVVSWSALIAGYAQQGQAEEALKCFDDMLREGHSPNVVTFISVLKACGSIRAAAKGEEIHNKVATLGLLEKEVVLGNSLIDMYMECGALAKAHRLFEEVAIRDVVSWNALIGGYVQQDEGEEALKWFDYMLHEGQFPTAVTFTCVLKAYGSIGAVAKGEEIHDRVVRMGLLEKNVVLGSTLVDMYVKFGALAKAHQVLKELSFRDMVSWNALITGYAQQGQGEEALKCFGDMVNEGHSPTAVTFAGVLKAYGSIGAVAKGEEIHEKIVGMGILEKNVVLGNSLVGMYIECGALARAQQVLKELSFRDVISWNALIAGYAQQGQGEEALKCFDDMLHEGYFPDTVTFTCVLKACRSIEAGAKGEEIHGKIVSMGMLEKNFVLGNALVDMYVKCGALAKAQQVLQELPTRDVVSWSALISGYAQQGQSVEAINCFERMQSNGVMPNVISLTAVLNACSHSGLLDEAETYFSGMDTKCGIHPSLEDYCCMTDAFGRAGKFNKALSVMAKMPYDKCLLSWVALLGACRKWAEVKIGKLAFEHALDLDKSNSTVYVLMADIYTAAGMQGEAHKIEAMRVANNAWK